MRRSCLGWDALGGMAGSSEAERSAYNRLSEGSSPSWPTRLDEIKNFHVEVQTGRVVQPSSPPIGGRSVEGGARSSDLHGPAHPGVSTMAFRIASATWAKVSPA